MYRSGFPGRYFCVKEGSGIPPLPSLCVPLNLIGCTKGGGHCKVDIAHPEAVANEIGAVRSAIERLAALGVGPSAGAHNHAVAVDALFLALEVHVVDAGVIDGLIFLDTLDPVEVVQLQPGILQHGDIVGMGRIGR